MWKQGTYRIQNPQKYIGGKTEIKYKSGLEERVMYFLDNNLNILRWNYEGISIIYLKPIFENWQIHHVEERKYYLDFYAEIKQKDGTIQRYLLEIKSKSATIPPLKPKKMTPKAQRRYINDCMVYAINKNKWNAAKVFCENKGWKFKMVLDDQIW